MQTAINPIADRISLISVSSTMKVSAEADRLRSEGVDVVDFGAGEPDFPTPDNIKQAAIRALEGNFTKYTAAGGTLELKKAICERHTQDFGTAIAGDTEGDLVPIFLDLGDLPLESTGIVYGVAGKLVDEMRKWDEEMGSAELTFLSTARAGAVILGCEGSVLALDALQPLLERGGV